MADWPPKIGSKWRREGLTREVLWRDDRRVQVRSAWRVKSGELTSHYCTLSRTHWESWPGQEVETFR